MDNVINKDCMLYMYNIPDNFFDLVVCDPPYGLQDRICGPSDGRHSLGTKFRMMKKTIDLIRSLNNHFSTKYLEFQKIKLFLGAITSICLQPEGL